MLRGALGHPRGRGSIRSPWRISAKVHKASTQTFNTSVTTFLTFDALDWDDAGLWVPSNYTDRFVIAREGLWSVEAFAVEGSNPNATVARSIYIYRGNAADGLTTVVSADGSHGLASGVCRAAASLDYYNVGDSVGVAYFVGGGAATVSIPEAALSAQWRSPTPRGRVLKNGITA